MHGMAPEAGRKVVVIGAGAVGSTFAYALALSGLAEEIVLVDRNSELARGQVADLAHGQPFFPPVSIRVGSASDYTDADVIVLTAGAKQRSGESRTELLKENAELVTELAGEIRDSNASGVLLMVANPVDILTYVALRETGWGRERVIGSGTVLDTARFRFLLGRYCRVDVHNIHAYILGEHGDSEFAAWSMTHVAGQSMDRYCTACGRCADWTSERERVEQEVRDSAYHIINDKGSTSFGVGVALVRIVGAILRGQRSVLTISTLLSGEYGLEDVCLGVPCIVGWGGAEKILSGVLPPQEQSQLEASARVLKEQIRLLYP